MSSKILITKISKIVNCLVCSLKYLFKEISPNVMQNNILMGSSKVYIGVWVCMDKTDIFLKIIKLRKHEKYR